MYSPIQEEQQHQTGPVSLTNIRIVAKCHKNDDTDEARQQVVYLRWEIKESYMYSSIHLKKLGLSYCAIGIK